MSDLKKEMAIAQYFAQVEPPKVAHGEIRARLEKLSPEEIEAEMVRRLNMPTFADEIRRIQQEASPLDVLDGDPE
jgi:hypothetical protein